MNNKQYKIFNLDERRPQVLVLGNGLTYRLGISWNQLIKGVSRPDVDLSKYDKKNAPCDVSFQKVPNTIFTLATSARNDSERHAKYSKVLNTVKYTENDKIKRLLGMPFDAIITTNYTYEIEATALPRYPELKNESKRQYSYVTRTETDKKYLIHTYNRISPDGKDIWHMHGELRRPSSMILSHDEYARYIHQIMIYNEKRGNDYTNYRKELKFKSWIDYFVLGDVYILGLSMDYSEFDLWWILGRRLREKEECGRIIFYEPLKSENYYKQLALSDAGVNVETCGITINNDKDYDKFYEVAINHIQNNLLGRGN